MTIHDVVRQEMFRILKDGDYRISVGNKKNKENYFHCDPELRGLNLPPCFHF